MGKAIGIDLGTTNSVACFCDASGPKILRNTWHEQLTPSVVAVHRSAPGEAPNVVVGRPAVNKAPVYPRDTVYSVKRLMGRAFQDEKVQQWSRRVAYEVTESIEPPRGLAWVRMGGVQYSPEQISGKILENIKNYASTALKDGVTHAVITVPAYFGDAERAATRDAGRVAGLVVKTLLPEPTAAAIAFGVEVPADGRFIVVYDLGGGTFDISVLSMVQKDGAPSFNVWTVGGDHFLGGDDFDQVIVDMIIKHVREKHGVDVSQDRTFLAVAKAEAEMAKKVLSAEMSAMIDKDPAPTADGKSVSIVMQVKREDFERAISPLVDRAKRLVEKTLEEQAILPEHVHDVLLVGGSTAVPLVVQSVEELFGADKVRRDVDPMHCVAMGAGILASRMKGVECPECKEQCDEAAETCSQGHSLAVARSVRVGIEIEEITSLPYGIQTVRGSDAKALRILVEKGTTVPMAKAREETFYTTEQDQRVIRIPVYQGEGSTINEHCRRVGEVRRELPLGLPRNHPVRIGLYLDRNAIAKVTIEIMDYAIDPICELIRGSSPDVEDASQSDAEGEDGEILDDDDEIDESERILVILEQTLEQAERFRDEYHKVLGGAERERLDRAIEDGRRLHEGDRSSQAQTAIVRLERAMTTSGTASVIRHARLVAISASPEHAASLNAVADEMQEAAAGGDSQRVDQQLQRAKAIMTEVQEQWRRIAKVDTTPDYDGLVRDKQGQ
jgi:molecular chaperone DnaK